jgi:hypothetical protein
MGREAVIEKLHTKATATEIRGEQTRRQGLSSNASVS